MKPALPVIGILGGMGPAATADFFSKLVEATPATSDQEHLPVLICSVPQIPDRADAYLHGGPSPEACLVHYARKLESAGAAMIVIPCNTAHIWYDAIRASVRTPVMHIADAVLDRLDAQFAAGSPPLRVGLLGTSATVQSALYERRAASRGRGIEWLVPDAPAQEALVMRGIAAVKSGRLDMGRSLLETAARGLSSRGIDCLVLACTEIPLVLDERAAGAPVLDATKLLARATVKQAFQASSALFSDIAKQHVGSSF